MTQIFSTDAQGQTLAAGLVRLWERFLPEIEQRLDVIEAAVSALASQNLSARQRDEAHAAAHKLAGILGTFG